MKIFKKLKSSFQESFGLENKVGWCPIGVEILLSQKLHKSYKIVFLRTYWPWNYMEVDTYMYVIVSLGSKYSKLLKHDPRDWWAIFLKYIYFWMELCFNTIFLSQFVGPVFLRWAMWPMGLLLEVLSIYFKLTLHSTITSNLTHSGHNISWIKKSNLFYFQVITLLSF